MCGAGSEDYVRSGVRIAAGERTQQQLLEKVSIYVDFDCLKEQKNNNLNRQW